MINFNDVPWYLFALTIIIASSTVAAGGFLLIRRLTNPQQLKCDQEIASYALNTIALLYCVIVGFVVIKVQERHTFVKETTTKEANLLLNLYYSSCDVFPQTVCRDIKGSVRRYARDVVEKEWPLMIEGKDLALAFPNSVHALWKTYDQITPTDSGQTARYQESLSRLNELTEARFGRLSNVERSESAFMWTVLIYGGILVIVSSYLFASTSLIEHVCQLVFISSFIALVLLLIFFLDSPYTGPTAIKPLPFENVLNIMDARTLVL